MFNIYTISTIKVMLDFIELMNSSLLKSFIEKKTFFIDLQNKKYLIYIQTNEKNFT
jgi:hypothetical protein